MPTLVGYDLAAAGYDLAGRPGHHPHPRAARRAGGVPMGSHQHRNLARFDR